MKTQVNRIPTGLVILKKLSICLKSCVRRVRRPTPQPWRQKPEVNQRCALSGRFMALSGRFMVLSGTLLNDVQRCSTIFNDVHVCSTWFDDVRRNSDGSWTKNSPIKTSIAGSLSLTSDSKSCGRCFFPVESRSRTI